MGHTDARTTRERTVSRESFLKRTERRFTASFFERLETWRMMLGAMGRRRSRAEALMMMDAMMTMDDVSTAFLGCGGRTRNERVIPRVEETTRGFLITVNAPGARGRATLRVRIRGREAIELGLPSKCVDVRAVPRASCIDGVLRIAVVKKSPEILRVPVESATEKAPSAETDDENENSDSVTTLSVPGFGARDISVTLHKPEDFLVVEGASKTFGNFKKTFTVPPELQLKPLAATVEHGLLHIKMEDPTAIERCAWKSEQVITVARRYPSTCRETWICLRSRRDAPTVFSPSRANATNPPVLKRWTSRSPASSPPSSSMPRSKLPRPVSYRRPKHLRRSTTMAESKTSPNNENIYATFTQHLRNIYTTFCNARTHS